MQIKTPPIDIEKTKESSESQNKKLEKKGDIPEIGGRQGPEPTRYGDWESSGRCVDF